MLDDADGTSRPGVGTITAMPNKLAFIEPAKPVLVETPPSGAGWIHEIKQDGFRTQIINEQGEDESAPLQAARRRPCRA